MGSQDKQQQGQQQAQELKQKLQNATVTNKDGDELKIADVRYDDQKGRVVIETR